MTDPTDKPSSHTEEFQLERSRRQEALSADAAFQEMSQDWVCESMRRRYVYGFDWLGRPIIQYPQDVLAMQELIWSVRPDLIIETGIAHGGSLIFSASMLALLDLADATKAGRPLDPTRSNRQVVGIDIDVRAHNRVAIESHPMARRIRMISGSSTAPEVISEVRGIATHYDRILIFLDSNHTHQHVLAELEAYAPLTTVGSYCVVFDTFVDAMPADLFPDRPWGPADNPKTAVREYLKTHPEFQIDKTIEYNLMITAAPDGYLKRIA